MLVNIIIFLLLIPNVEYNNRQFSKYFEECTCRCMLCCLYHSKNHLYSSLSLFFCIYTLYICIYKNVYVYVCMLSTYGYVSGLSHSLANPTKLLRWQFYFWNSVFWRIKLWINSVETIRGKEIKVRIERKKGGEGLKDEGMNVWIYSGFKRPNCLLFYKQYEMIDKLYKGGSHSLQDIETYDIKTSVMCVVESCLQVSFVFDHTDLIFGNIRHWEHCLCILSRPHSAVLFNTNLTFLLFLENKFSNLKLEAIGSSETLTRNFYQNTRRHVPESCTINFTLCSLCTCRLIPKLITKTATDTEV